MVSVSGDLGGNSGVVRPGTCRLLFCLLLLVVVVIIIALFGGGVWRETASPRAFAAPATFKFILDAPPK